MLYFFFEVLKMSTDPTRESKARRFLKNLPETVSDMIFYALGNLPVEEMKEILCQYANHVEITTGYGLGSSQQYFPDPEEVQEANDIFIGFGDPKFWGRDRGGDTINLIFQENDETRRRCVIAIGTDRYVITRMKLYLILTAPEKISRHTALPSDIMSCRILDQFMDDVCHGHTESFKRYLSEIEDIRYFLDMYAYKYALFRQNESQPDKKTHDECINDLIDICQENDRLETLMTIFRLTKDDEKPATTLRL
jgi:hypothetical protein